MIQRLDLSGSNWEFHYAETDRWLSATVPGCVHTDLRRHELIPDPFYGENEKSMQWIERLDWRYRTTFEVSAGLLAESDLELVFEGLDTLATVSVNGQVVGTTENMFCQYRFSVKPQLRVGQNTLEILFTSTLGYLKAHEAWQPVKERNDPVGGRSRIRKEQCQYSWDWGPRFVTCGVWRPARLEARSTNRLETVRVDQTHEKGAATLRFVPELGRTEAGARFRVSASFDGKEIASATGTADALTLRIAAPALWWPAGQGAQPLYTVKTELIDAAGKVLDTWQRRIGLRTIELVRDNDAAGQTFYFRVNGRAIFAKGANWIPDHSFVNECTRESYAERLGAAVDAHMNMIRVWGGGIYEHEMFYDLCDEMGLLVWQDFMFACALYPGAPDYCELVRVEAEHQIRRLRHHASLALWCGNNEIPMMDILIVELRKDPAKMQNYENVFHGVLPRAVEAFDPATPYWPSSPWTPAEISNDANFEGAGDTHYWEVWHARAPVKSYEKLTTRFCSEFGMQSYASAALAETFCPPESLNVFSKIMENHQKNGGGNATMLHYMSQRYRYASGYANLAYLSQLNQAYCMKVGVEHFRHRMPDTMGALYWQINDTWPVASWASIEFKGRWKALHHEARRFFAPSLVYLRTEGDVVIGRYNEIFNSINSYDIYTIHDDPQPRAARLKWSLRTLSGRLVGTEQVRDVTLEYNQVQRHGTCEFAAAGESFTREQVYLRADLVATDGTVLSRQTVFFTQPRFIEFADPAISVEVRAVGAGAEIKLTSPTLAPAVALEFGQHTVWLSDNWLDLHAGETRTITARVPAGLTVDALRSALTITSLWHSYQA